MDFWFSLKTCNDLEKMLAFFLLFEHNLSVIKNINITIGFRRLLLDLKTVRISDSPAEILWANALSLTQITNFY